MSFSSACICSYAKRRHQNVDLRMEVDEKLHFMTFHPKIIEILHSIKSGVTLEKSQGIIKVRVIHPVETMNTCSKLSSRCGDFTA